MTGSWSLKKGELSHSPPQTRPSRARICSSLLDNQYLPSKHFVIANGATGTHRLIRQPIRHESLHHTSLTSDSSTLQTAPQPDWEPRQDTWALNGPCWSVGCQIGVLPQHQPHRSMVDPPCRVPQLASCIALHTHSAGPQSFAYLLYLYTSYEEDRSR